MGSSVDAVVLGLGAHGSAAALALARRGLRVVGLEAGARGERRGSSGGRSRMIRRAYFEDTLYLPLLDAAWAGWRSLEAEVGEDLLVETGGLYMGDAASPVFAASVASARTQGLPSEVLEAAEIRRRWPAFAPDDAMGGLSDPGAASIDADRAIGAQLGAAEALGADLRFETRATGWWPAAGGTVEVETADGGRMSAGSLVIAAGPWTGALLPDLALPIEVERVPVFWFEPAAGASVPGPGPGRMPMWLMDTGRDGTFYGFPFDPELGLKVGRHFSGEVVEPDAFDRTAGPADLARVARFVDRHLPGARTDVRGAVVCLYAVTPDHHFVIDRHPGPGNVAFASACSGHGFKFAPVVGAALADLAVHGRTDAPIEPFRAARFAGG